MPPRWRPWSRVRPGRSEEGFTLIELLVSMALITVVLALSFTVITKIISSTTSSQSRSNAIDEARAAVSQMERQIRSGNVISQPTYANGTWLLQVYTQVNGNQRCVQWKVVSTADTLPADQPYLNTLRFRSWSSSYLQDGDVTNWTTVAHGIVNTPALASPDPSVSLGAPFLRTPYVYPGLSTGPSPLLSPNPYGGRLLSVHLLVKTSSKGPGSTVIDSAITGRNTSFGYDQTLCTQTIPGG
jgi:prepilin-type N-terminal cleavage/methylation domain-containing protein